MLWVSVWESQNWVSRGEKGERPSRTAVTSALDSLRIPLAWGLLPRDICVVPVSHVCLLPCPCPVPGTWQVPGSSCHRSTASLTCHCLRSIRRQEHASRLFSLSCGAARGPALIGPLLSAPQWAVLAAAPTAGLGTSWEEHKDLPLCPKFQWESRQPPERQMAVKWPLVASTRKESMVVSGWRATEVAALERVGASRCWWME